MEYGDANAVEKARSMFPEIGFEVANCKQKGGLSMYYADLLVCRQLFWYVFDKLETTLQELKNASKKYCLIEQSFPNEEKFVGSDIIPNPEALNKIICRMGFSEEYRIWQKAPWISNVVFLGLYKKTDKYHKVEK